MGLEMRLGSPKAYLAAAIGAAVTLFVVSEAMSRSDDKAHDIVTQMTLDEKIRLVHGVMPLPFGPAVTLPADVLPSAGYIEGIPHLGIPALRETDASLGVAYVMGLRHDGATALPSGLASAAGWNPQSTYEAGAMIGREAWRKGFNVLLAGGANLTRDPRNGRNFEYLGEDPLLAGTLAGAAMRGIQAQHVISTLKHFALNNQETGRHDLNVRIEEAAARESDLLAFEIALEAGHPGAVMCSYNRVNGPYACDNDWLLNRVLKTDWHFPGWVMSDWGAVPGIDAALHGLDQQSGEQLDKEIYFGALLKQKAQSDPIWLRRLDDMALRIVYSMQEIGIDAYPPQISAIDFAADAAIAQRVAEEGIVLLSNPRNLLPLAAKAQNIAIIGGHADIGVISGGGSSQVAPPGGPAATIPLGGLTQLEAFFHTALYMPSSPLAAIRSRNPHAHFAYDSGEYVSAAAALAKRSDLVILFATKWMGEGVDAPDLTLPGGQDALIDAVTKANPNTIIVLETGGPVLMPWLNQAGAVLEAWYPGARGGEAIARVLFGDVDAAGHLPMTFPVSEAQLPNREMPGAGLTEGTGFDVSYPEGSNVGYRWFAAQDVKPLFAFGHGLSYTQFRFGGLALARGRKLTASFTVTNTGAREGIAVPQLYLLQAPQGTRQRLVGWERLALKPGESRTVTVAIDQRLLADWSQERHGWSIKPGRYAFALGMSAQMPVGSSSDVILAGRVLPP